MIESHVSSPVLPQCRLRPALASDRRQIRELTRRLQQVAVPASKWQSFGGWVLIGLLTFLCLRYPQMGAALLVSATPLIAVVVLALMLADRDQQQQYERYWVMEYNGQIVGCGRIDIHPQHSEIYDLFVSPAWRSGGVGRSIIQQLIAQSTRPVYLASLPQAVSFYRQFGFRPIAARELPVILAGRLSLNSPRYRQVGLQPMMLQ